MEKFTVKTTESIGPVNESTETEKRSDYNLPPIAERYNHLNEFIDLEYPMKKLVEGMKSEIECGYYDVIVSDEVGGRIPSLILKKVIDHVNESRSVKKSVPVYFLNFGRDSLDEQALDEFFKKTDLKDKSILFVTEAIESGLSTKKAIDIFEKNNIEAVDVAAVAISENSSYSSWNSNSSIEGKKMFSGFSSASKSPTIDRTGPVLTGVDKEYKEYIIAGAHPKKLEKIEPRNRRNEFRKDLRAKYIKKVWGTMSKQEQRKSINDTRLDIDMMSKVILQSVWGVGKTNTDTSPNDELEKIINLRSELRQKKEQAKKWEMESQKKILEQKEKERVKLEEEKTKQESARIEKERISWTLEDIDALKELIEDDARYSKLLDDDTFGLVLKNKGFNRRGEFVGDPQNFIEKRITELEVDMEDLKIDMINSFFNKTNIKYGDLKKIHIDIRISETEEKIIKEKILEAKKRYGVSKLFNLEFDRLLEELNNAKNK